MNGVAVSYFQRARHGAWDGQDEAHVRFRPILADERTGEVNILDVVDCHGDLPGACIGYQVTEKMRDRYKRFLGRFVKTGLPDIAGSICQHFLSRPAGSD